MVSVVFVVLLSSVGCWASANVGLIPEDSDLACPTGNCSLGKTGPVAVEVVAWVGVVAMSTVGFACSLILVGAECADACLVCETVEVAPWSVLVVDAPAVVVVAVDPVLKWLLGLKTKKLDVGSASDSALIIDTSVMSGVRCERFPSAGPVVEIDVAEVHVCDKSVWKNSDSTVVNVAGGLDGVPDVDDNVSASTVCEGSCAESLWVLKVASVVWSAVETVVRSFG